MTPFTRWLRKNRSIAIGGAIIVLLVIFVSLVFRFGWDWTGFTEQTGPQLHPYEQYRPAKTLWDVLQLFIIPAVLAIIAYLFNRASGRKEQELASDSQREAALQGYLDKMSKLLLKEHLATSRSDEEVRKIARARTLTVLRGLDPVRKGSLLRFLYESSLISWDVNNGIVDLKDADLSLANLTYATLSEAFLQGNIALSKTWMSREDARINLQKAKLSGVLLKGAILHGARLCEADLSGAYLSRVDLIGANLHKANLQGAKLRKASLQGADLTRADLSGANLHLADLTGADLSGAILDGANLKEAVYDPKQLDMAQSKKEITE